MPKRPNNLPGLRVDITDYEQNGHVFTVDSFEHFAERALLSNYSRVLEGFRVEIADQTTNPGLFTIHSGVAYNRDGQIVDNENDLAAQRSVTLLADGTYFVEIEFTTGASDTDARAFWDPLYDNGSDPSGDVRPLGREFDANVATRNTPDWTVITPVSTTAFTYVSTPDTNRIPVAVLTVASGAITGGTTYSARSILEQDAAISATSIRAGNSRIFPDAFSATLGGAAITVTANDRENNVLTLASGLAAGHTRGERIVQTGSGIPVFLAERTTGTIPSSGTADARNRFFQGDEERGYALGQDPYTDTGKSDVEVKSLKDQIDFLAAEIRELKWGSSRATDIGNLAPPSSFPAVPKYFDKAGGLLGGRGHTVSVGDGVTCWGDFNTTQSGSAKAALEAAYAALPSTGGTIYVKGSATPYAFATSADFSTAGKHVVIKGDGRESTILEATGAVPALTSSDVNFILNGLSVTCDSGATTDYAVVCTDSPFMGTYDVYVDGFDVDRVVPGQIYGAFYFSDFESVNSAGGVGFSPAEQFNYLFSGSNAHLDESSYNVDYDDFYCSGAVVTSQADVQHSERTVMIPATACYVHQTTTDAEWYNVAGTTYLQPESGAAVAIMPLVVTVGDRIKAVRGRVRGTTNGAITMKVWKQIDGAAATQIGTTKTSGTAAADETLEVTSLTETVVEGTNYYIEFEKASSSIVSRIYYGKLTFDRVA